MKIRIKEARIVSNTRYPGEEGSTQVLVLAATLTPPIAERLGIRDGCYNSEGVPRNYDRFPSSRLRIDGADLSLGDKEFRATLIHKFTVKQPKSGNDNDTHLELGFRVHFGEKEVVDAWARNTNKDTFSVLVNARQEDLNFGDADEAPNEEDLEEPECIHCANGVPMSLVAGIHENENKCTAYKKPEPALASARESVGGTHQKRARRQAAEEVVQ